MNCARAGCAWIGITVLLAANWSAAQIVPGATFEVGTSVTHGAIQQSNLATGADGNLLVLWDNYVDATPQNGMPDTASGIYARLYSADGAPLATALRCDESGHANPHPALTAAGGGYVAAWPTVVTAATPTGFQATLRARRIAANGVPLGNELILSDANQNAVGWMSAVPLGGGAVVVWYQDLAIHGRYVDYATGNLGQTFLVGESPGNEALDATALTDGGFAVVWCTEPGRPNSRLRLFGADAQARGAWTTISTEVCMRRVAAAANGTLAVMGNTADYATVKLRFLGSDGVPTSPHLLARQAPNQYASYVSSFDLDFDLEGRLFTVWGDYAGATYPPPLAQLFDASGQALGNGEPISSVPNGHVSLLRLADGRFATTWNWFSSTCCTNSVWATITGVCSGEDCAPVPTPTAVTTAAVATVTASATPTETAVPTPTQRLPQCGDGLQEKPEECDDGNRLNGDGCDQQCRVEVCGNSRLEGDEQCDDGNQKDGDGCQANCRRTPKHDSVMVPEKAIDVVIPSGQASATKVVPLQVRNADDGERPGHVIQLLASDGTCPPGTIDGRPDFERGVEGDQDSIEVLGGTPKTALVRVIGSRQQHPDAEHKIPSRCSLRFTAVTVIDGNVDPTPENNTITVELNVRLAGHDDDSERAELAAPEFFVTSLKPTRLSITRGKTSASKRLAFHVTAGATPLGKLRDVQVSVDDGDCPTGTIRADDLDAGVGGMQDTWAMQARDRRHGRLTLSVSRDAVSSRNARSPRHCTAAVHLSSASADSDAANHTTRLTIELLDQNDF